MASGVKVDEVVKLKYDDIKKKKSYRYLVFYIKDEKVITVEKVGSRDCDYNHFLNDLTGAGPDDCRYILIMIQCNAQRFCEKRVKSGLRPKNLRPVNSGNEVLILGQTKDVDIYRLINGWILKH